VKERAQIALVNLHQPLAALLDLRLGRASFIGGPVRDLGSGAPSPPALHPGFMTSPHHSVLRRPVLTVTGIAADFRRPVTTAGDGFAAFGAPVAVEEVPVVARMTNRQ
jgi:hypothetical protein